MREADHSALPHRAGVVTEDDKGLGALLNQLAINVAVLTSSLNEMKDVLSGLRATTATKESVEQIAGEVRDLKTKIEVVDDKHEKKWDRLLWAVFSLVLGAVVLAALSQGGIGK